MFDNGFIKLNRSMLSWEWYGNPYTTIVFLHILLRANWKDKNWQGKVIKKGQLVTSIRKLAKELNISFQHTRTALANLQKTHEITLEPTNKYSIITVVAWDKYQEYNTDLNTQPNTQTTHNLTHKQHTISEEEKEVKNIKRESAHAYTHAHEGETVVDAYNRLCPNLKPIGFRNYQNAIAKLHDAINNERLTYDQVIQAFKKANHNEFLTGKVNGFIPGFDWIINPDHIMDILEGKYERTYTAPVKKTKTETLNHNYNLEELQRAKLQHAEVTNDT